MQFLQGTRIKKSVWFSCRLSTCLLPLFHGMNKYMVFGSKPYEDYLSYPLFGGPLRGVFFVIGLLGIIGFLRLVPRQQLFFYQMGQEHTVSLFAARDLLLRD